MTGLTVASVLARGMRAQALVEPAESIDEAVVAAAGIYGTAPTSHLGLAARLDGYAPAELERQRLEARSILRVPGMRGSVFLAPRELVPAFLGLSRPRTVRRTLAGAGIAEATAERLMDLVEAALTEGSLPARQIRGRLGHDDPGGPVTTLILRGMVHEGRVVGAAPIGGERATAFRYARMAEWAPLARPVPDVDEALAAWRRSGFAPTGRARSTTSLGGPA